MDLSRSFIYLGAKIVKPDGHKFDQSKTLYTRRFRTVKLNKCGPRIRDGKALYPYYAYIETLLNYEKESREHQLQLMLLCESTPGNMKGDTTTI